MGNKLCKCGCGREIIFLLHHKYKGIPDYIRGHNPCVSFGEKRKGLKSGKKKR